MRATNDCVERLLLAVCELLALEGVGVQPAVEGFRAGLAVERVVDVTYDETITVAPTNAGGVTLNCTVTFELNGAPGGPDFEQHTAVTVNGADLSITKTGPAFAQRGHLTRALEGPATRPGPRPFLGGPVAAVTPIEHNTPIRTPQGVSER